MTASGRIGRWTTPYRCFGACCGPVEGMLGGADPFVSVRDAVRHGSFGEIIVSTLSTKPSKWLRRDLVKMIEGLGLAVTTVTPTRKSLSGAVEDDDVTRGLGLAWGGEAAELRRGSPWKMASSP